MDHQPHSVGFDLVVVGQIKVYPSATYVTPLDLQPEQVVIEDIAHALSRVCRFGGHCAGFISVAQHSVAVSYMVSEELALDGLLHDASEAYLGDMCRPVKRHPSMDAYVQAEERAHAAIAQKFGTTYPHPAAIKQADNNRLEIEIALLRDCPTADMGPVEAFELFMARYRELTQ